MCKLTNKSSYFIALTILIVGLLPNIVQALLIEYSLPELVKESDIICRGKVIKTECRWGSPDWDQNSHLIFTDITLSASEFYKGKPEKKELIITCEGGEVGEVGLLVEDMPQFKIGEEVLVFLGKETSKGTRTVTNLYNGKYTISQGRVLEKNEPINRFVNRVKNTVKEQQRRER